MYLKKIATVKTNNSDADVMSKILELWKTNWATLEKELKTGNNIYALYHDYKSNYKGDYSLSLCIVGDEKDFTFELANFLSKDYEVDTLDEMGVFKTWQKIWSEEEEQKIYRSYIFDYEEYFPDGNIKIKIGINK